MERGGTTPASKLTAGFELSDEFKPSDRTKAATNEQSNSLNLLALFSDKPPAVKPEPAAAKSEPQKQQDTDKAHEAEKSAAKSPEHHHRHKPSDVKTELKKDLPAEKDLKEGDIIFRSSSAFEEGKAIQLVSKSPLTHCGILVKEGKDWFVYEAVQPVQKTPLKDFHKTDEGETYVVRRLKDADKILTDKALEKMKTYLKDNVGKDYDHKFGWGDDRMYCSELVWKAYYTATRVKVGKIQMVGDFDLSDPLVKKHVEARYGKNVPVTEPTITPGAVYDSRLLQTIK